VFQGQENVNASWCGERLWTCNCFSNCYL